MDIMRACLSQTRVLRQICMRMSPGTSFFVAPSLALYGEGPAVWKVDKGLCLADLLQKNDQVQAHEKMKHVH